MTPERRGAPGGIERLMSTKAWRRAVGYLGPEEERWGTILLLALVVGLLAGGSAVALRSAVHLVFQGLEALRTGWWGPVLPAIGAAAGVAIVSLIFREAPGHGVPEVIRAVCRDGGRMRRRSMLSRWMGSLVNVSSGGLSFAFRNSAYWAAVTKLRSSQKPSSTAGHPGNPLSLYNPS